MNDNLLKKSCKCYKRAGCYSKRYKKPVTKQVSLIRHTEQEADEILDTFRKFIKRDNELYVNEKKVLDGETFQSKTPHLKNVDEKVTELERIDLSRIVDGLDKDTGNNICVFATSKSGKTVLVKALTEEMIKKDPSLIVCWFVGNRGAPIYKDIINSDRHVFFDGLKPSVVETLKEINSQIEDKYNFLFILDDIIDARNTAVVKNLACSYRNNMCSSIFLLQFSTLVVKGARGCSTVYLFGQNKNEEVNSLMEKFLRSNPYFKDLKNINEKIKLYQQTCSDHNFIVSFPLENDNEKLYITKTKI